MVVMRFLLALVVLFGGHVDQSETVDLIELNHYTSSENYGFSQVIFWEFSPDKRCHIVRDWILASAIVSHPCKLNGGHECSVEVDGRKYKVRSKLFRETFTDYDPEMRNRKLHHESLRNVMPWRHWEREPQSEVAGGINP
jgi:hypothetical protein